MGSASELEYHLLLAHDHKLIEASIYGELVYQWHELKKMIASFINKLKTI